MTEPSNSISMVERASNLLGRAAWFLWLMLLITIPWTSSRWVVKIIGLTPVSPLALIPLVILFLVWFIPYLLRGGKLPVYSWPLLALLVIVIAADAAAFFLPLEPYKGRTLLSREIRALITLGIGFAFYFLASLMPDSEAKVRDSLRALYYGAILTMVWASVQAYFVLDGTDGMPYDFIKLHRQFVIRQPIGHRVSGLAFEPSWLADQLVVLYLPLWFSSVINRFSVFRTRRSWVSVELFLGIWGIMILALTFSRGGYLTFFAISGVLYLLGIWKLTGWLSWRMLRANKAADNIRRRVLQIMFSLILISVFIGAVGAVAVFVSERDTRMMNLLGIPAQIPEARALHPGTLPFELARRLGIAERVVFWEAGYRPFEKYPVLGVGLGNAGFLFPDMVTPSGVGLTEIREILDPSNSNFPNPKNLWIRLLSETGILGFSAFVAWLILLGSGSYVLMRNSKLLYRVIGVSGAIAVAAVALENFSLDTFALPQMWIATGLLTASCRRIGHQKNK
ncbi:MAG: O-antigen ligase family protein [Anaerolineales bacterium]|nr:O-antigen ligase family protein [Anaerolineales bacterium]